MLEMVIPMTGRMIHSLSGRMSVQPYGRKGQSIYSIDRRKLNELLLTNAEGKRGISVHFKYKKT